MKGKSKKIDGKLREEIESAKAEGGVLGALFTLAYSAHVRSEAECRKLAEKAIAAAEGETGEKHQILTVPTLANAFLLTGSSSLLEALAEQPEIAFARLNGRVRSPG